MITGIRSPVARIFSVSIAALCLLIWLLSPSTSRQSLSIWKNKLNEQLNSYLNMQTISSPYAHTRFSGKADLAAFQKPPVRIVGFILAGRQEFVRILDCYLQRNLVRNGGWLDEVIWIIRTDVAPDIEYLQRLVASVPEYTGHLTHYGPERAYGTLYKLCPRGAICIKIDDDVVFWEDHTIPAIVKRKLQNPARFSVVSANVMNQPALAWVHYHLDAVHPYLPELAPPSSFIEDEHIRNTDLDWRPSTMPGWRGPKGFKFNASDAAPFKGHRWLRLPDEVMNFESTPVAILGEGAAGRAEYAANGSGFSSWAIAAQEHYSFLENLERDELYRYKFDLWHYHYDRLSINFVAFSGDDVHDHEVKGSDEQFLTVTLPKRLKKPAVLDGTAMAVHFGFHRQVYGHGGIPGDALNHTDLLARYESYAKEFVCGRKMGTPRI